MVRSRCSGTVVSFDAARGRGVVEADGARHEFHSTRLADGSRTVALGTAVTFEVAPGPLGRWEAVDLQPSAGG